MSFSCISTNTNTEIFDVCIAYKHSRSLCTVNAVSYAVCVGMWSLLVQQKTSIMIGRCHQMFSNCCTTPQTACWLRWAVEFACYTRYILNAGDKAYLRRAYREHINSRGLLHRVFPPRMHTSTGEVMSPVNNSLLLREDRILAGWIQAKCQDSPFWCQ